MAVTVGLDRLLTEPALHRMLVDRRVGLLANPNSVSANLTHAIDLMQAAELNLVRLFGPEHGVRGHAQDMETVSESVDPISGLPYVSLYGATEDSLRPDPSDLAGVDVMVIDLQDIGARYYTYIYTAAYVAEECGKQGIDVIVCDRPNPLGGEVVEGNVVLPEYRSFVGHYPLATRHGMTFGELMRLFVADFGLGCELTIAEMTGWQRSMFYDDCGIPWIMPSPNMPTLDTAMVYPGQCLLEGTNLSEARGTTRPFELFGAPWLDAQALLERLSASELAGCAFRLAGFKPMFQKWGGRPCQGLQVHVTDRSCFRSLTFSLALLKEVLALHPEEFAWRTEVYEFVSDRLAIDLLLGDALARHGLEDGVDVHDLVASFSSARAEFEDQRSRALIY